MGGGSAPETDWPERMERVREPDPQSQGERERGFSWLWFFKALQEVIPKGTEHNLGLRDRALKRELRRLKKKTKIGFQGIKLSLSKRIHKAKMCFVISVFHLNGCGRLLVRMKTQWV